MNDLPQGLQVNIAEIKSGDHVCFIFNNKAQLFNVLASYLLEGLNNKQKCVYVVDKNTPAQAKDELKNANREIDKFYNSDGLSVVTKDQSYLQGGNFDVLKMINYIKKSEEEFMHSGYEGLRGVGEMSWALDDLNNVGKLIDYEGEINLFIPDSNSTLICAYDETLFPKEVLLKAIAAHPYLIIYDKFYRNKQYYQPYNLNQKDFSNVSYDEVVQSIKMN